MIKSDDSEEIFPYIFEDFGQATAKKKSAAEESKHQVVREQNSLRSDYDDVVISCSVYAQFMDVLGKINRELNINSIASLNPAQEDEIRKATARKQILMRIKAEDGDTTIRAFAENIRAISSLNLNDNQREILSILTQGRTDISELIGYYESLRINDDKSRTADIDRTISRLNEMVTQYQHVRRYMTELGYVGDGYNSQGLNGNIRYSVPSLLKEIDTIDEEKAKRELEKVNASIDVMERLDKIRQDLSALFKGDDTSDNIHHLIQNAKNAAEQFKGLKKSGLLTIDSARNLLLSIDPDINLENTLFHKDGKERHRANEPA